jgi:hypothetical protein
LGERGEAEECRRSAEAERSGLPGGGEQRQRPVGRRKTNRGIERVEKTEDNRGRDFSAVKVIYSAL